MNDSTWVCPNQPFAHDWRGGLTCRLCGATRTAADAITSLLAGFEGWDESRAAALVDQHRTEVLHDNETEPIPARWDRTVIHPHHPNGDTDGDTIVCLLADDGTRRPIGLFLDDEHRDALGLQLVDPNGDDTAPADFFQPGHTYKHAAWTFRADAITNHAETGERTVLGWFRFLNDTWRPLSCGEAEWAEGVWTDITSTEAAEGR